MHTRPAIETCGVAGDIFLDARSSDGEPARAASFMNPADDRAMFGARHPSGSGRLSDSDSLISQTLLI
jgi:hypothetical protein